MDSAPHRVFIKVLVLLTTLNSQLTTRNENVFVQSQNEKKKMKLSISSIRKSVFMLPIIHFLPTPLCLPFLSWSADRGCRCHCQLSFQRESWQPSCNPFTSTAPGLSSTKKKNKNPLPPISADLSHSLRPIISTTTSVYNRGISYKDNLFLSMEHHGALFQETYVW